MQLRLKIFLLSIVPMVIALGAVILTVQHQTLKLARQERDLVETTYLASKEAELRSYVKLAQSSIAPLVKSGASPEKQAEAMALLGRMEFGQDGYFFVYDMAGNNLMHSRQPDLVGKNLREMRDPYGGTPIRSLLEATQRGGGTVRYYWEKPSSHQIASKLGYVEPVLPWGWMVGTGLYLDDIEQTLSSIDAQAQANIRDTQVHVYTIAAAAVMLIGAAGLALNLSDQKESSAKLRHLAQRVVHSQEDERARIARELHDGIIQVLVSSKFFLETAQLQLDNSRGPGAASGSPPAKIATTLKRGLERLSEALIEVRRISHGLRPALLDDLGLVPAMELLVNEAGEQGPFAIQFETRGLPFALPPNQSTALFRISQESLTNARLHAEASQVRVTLTYRKRLVELSINDDGHGFDIDRVQTDQRSGIGLRNMRERMEGLGGALKIRSGPSGTCVTATLTTATPSTLLPPADTADLQVAAEPVHV